MTSLDTTIREFIESSDEIVITSIRGAVIGARGHKRNLNETRYSIGTTTNDGKPLTVMTLSEEEYNSPLTFDFLETYLCNLYLQAYKKGRLDLINELKEDD